MFLLSRSALLSALASLFVLAAFGAQAQTYASGFTDAKWVAQSGSFACSLSHQIPAFGTAYFGQNAGAAGFFEFRGAKKVFPAGTVRLEAVPPSWSTDVVPQVLFTLSVNSVLRLNPEQLKILAASLERGTNVVFSGANASDNAFRVIVDARNFEASYATYKRCVANIIPYTFGQLSRTVINYAVDAQALSPATKIQLDKVVRYTKADSKVLGILVDAHSDKREMPEEAELLSQQQAELVAGYLIDKGLPAESITVRWHGDKFPIADNKEKAGQAKNRRITLRLENESTRKDREQRVAVLRAAEEKAAAEQAAKVAAEAEKQGTSETASVTTSQLEQLVEQQNLNSGKQPGL
jgi:outer membrane protein OmpA-like peptidoglycan-associated protein